MHHNLKKKGVPLPTIRMHIDEDMMVTAIQWDYSNSNGILVKAKTLQKICQSMNHRHLVFGVDMFKSRKTIGCRIHIELMVMDNPTVRKNITDSIKWMLAQENDEHFKNGVFVMGSGVIYRIFLNQA